VGDVPSVASVLVSDREHAAAVSSPADLSKAFDKAGLPAAMASKKWGERVDGMLRVVAACKKHAAIGAGSG